MSAVDDDKGVTESFHCIVMVPETEKGKHPEMKKGGKEECMERERPISTLCIKSKERRRVCVCVRARTYIIVV